MFSFLSALVPKSRGAADPAHSPDELFDEDPASVFVPPAPLIHDSVVESAEPVTVHADSPAEEAVAEAHAAEVHVAEAQVAETPVEEMPVADVPVVDVSVVDARSVEEELREERLLIERQLAERLEEQRLAEERHLAEEQRAEEQRAEEAAAEERRVAEQRERWRAEQAAEAKRLRAEREEVEQQEADRIVAEREETERRAVAQMVSQANDAAPEGEAARFSWPATLLHHAAPMNYGAGVRRHLLSTIVELRDPNLVAVLYDALYEESGDGLRPDVLEALRAAYHCEALRDTYERFARIGNDREREIAREGLFALAARAS